MSESCEQEEYAGPFFDPSLGPGRIAALSERSDRLLPSHDVPAGSRVPFLPSLAAVVTAGILASAALTAAVFLLTPYFPTTLMALSLALMSAGSFVMFRDLGAVQGLLTLIAAAGLLALAAWLGATGTVIAVTSVAALSGLVGTGYVALWYHDHRLPAVHHGRYLVPQDFGERERRLLGQVRAVRQAVEGQAPALGAHFDGAGAARTLAEQEWRLARFLRTQTALRTDLEARSRAAVSETVREAMRPQAEALTAAMGVAEQRVQTVLDYGDTVSRAALKQREWEQVEQTLARDDAYGDHLAEASTRVEDEPDSTELTAIQQVRDESVREAVEAGRRLSRAADLT